MEITHDSIRAAGGIVHSDGNIFFRDISMLQGLAGAAPAAAVGPAGDGWLQDGGLLYRLTDERRPQNRDEINVTMADGSRSNEARARRAGELLDRIRAAAPQAPDDLKAIPVAGQCRFKGEKEWGTCATEHVRMVLAGPSYAADGYEVRFLYDVPLPAEPGPDVSAKVAPSGWRAVIDSHCDRLLDIEPSSYDSQGYRDFARSVLDGVADELAVLEADPATKRQEAEAIKAEFLERTGQYLTNDASREACIAEAVAAEREAAAPYVRDAMRYRLLRRGQHWSVIDWKGDVLRGDELDLTIDAKNAAKAAAKETP